MSAEPEQQIIEKGLTDSDSEKEFVEENDFAQPAGVAPTSGPNTGSEPELYSGKHFSSLEEAEACYIEYAGKRGYSIRKKKPYYRGRAKVVTGYLFTCSCQGTHIQKNTNVQRNRSHGRKECKARMSVHWLGDTNVWMVFTFVDEHSHELVSPSKQILLRSNRKIPESAKKLSENFHDRFLRVSSVPSMFGETSALGFNSRDCYNHLRNVRHSYNKDGDAEGVKAFFEDKVAENPHFYYDIDVDDEGSNDDSLDDEEALDLDSNDVQLQFLASDGQICQAP